MQAAHILDLSVEMAEACLSKEGGYELPPCRISDPEAAALVAREAEFVDYSSIVELTPRAADSLVATLNGNEDAGQPPAVEEDTPLALDGLREISIDVAAALANYSRGALHLDGLLSLSPEVAHRLSHLHSGMVSLGSLKDVSPDTFSHLLATRHGVSLNAVESLGPEYVDVLLDAPKGWGETPKWQLQLNGLRFLPDATAEAVVSCAKGMRRVVYQDTWEPLVTLDGLTVLDSPALARAGIRGERPVIRLSLETIQWISSRAAATLGRNFFVNLPRMRHVTPAIARAFAASDSFVSLGAISEITPKTARAFGRKRRGRLALNGLKTLSVEIAEGLAHASVERLSLSGVTALDAATAEKLASSVADCIELRGLELVDDSVAAALACFKGAFKLNLLSLPTVLRSPLASLLAKHEGAMSLRGVEELTADAAGELSLHGGTEMGLDELKVLPAFVAEKLVPYVGKLSLCGLTRITDETAAKLVDYQGWALILRGLESPSREQLSLLSRNPRIKLPGQ